MKAHNCNWSDQELSVWGFRCLNADEAAIIVPLTVTLQSLSPTSSALFECTSLLCPDLLQSHGVNIPSLTFAHHSGCPQKLYPRKHCILTKITQLKVCNALPGMQKKKKDTISNWTMGKLKHRDAKWLTAGLSGKLANGFNSFAACCYPYFQG